MFFGTIVDRLAFSVCHELGHSAVLEIAYKRNTTEHGLFLDLQIATIVVPLVRLCQEVRARFVRSTYPPTSAQNSSPVTKFVGNGPAGLAYSEINIVNSSSTGTNERRLIMPSPVVIMVWNGKMNWLTRCHSDPSCRMRFAE